MGEALMSYPTLKPAAVTIGPEDDGRPMMLADFEFAIVKEGHRYELSRGIVTVSDVPNFAEFFIEEETREQLTIYKISHPEVITAIATGSNCKVLVNEFESERHPDLSIYMTLPPSNGRQAWRRWLPRIVVEVVSRSSKKRDYAEKREEYLALGIKEYWIIDPGTQEMLALCRYRGQWRETTLTSVDTYETRLLPGFRLDLAKVFAAADKA
jgi:Uma2 family endonuclease